MIHRPTPVFLALAIILSLTACSGKHAKNTAQGKADSAQAARSSKPMRLYSQNGSGQARSHSAGDEFPMPQALEPQVEFWRNTYTRWHRTEFALHDKLHMNVVYEVVEIPGPVGDHLSPEQKAYVQARVDDWKYRLVQLEEKAAGGGTLSDDEQELVRQMGGRENLYGASERLRQQRGLRERFKRGLLIGSRYERQFREIFRNAGLPEDLAYLPHVESSFQANARSSAGAVGIWQFTAGAARIFMNGDDSVAARTDPIASTYGAARYLSQAHDKLGTWPLAITSYNHGIGGMQKAKSRYGHDFTRIVKEYDHPQFGFASRNYYAEFLAAREIAREPQRYFPEGLDYASNQGEPGGDGG